jgi:N-acyl homoserine lactone hydrolase
MGLKIELLTTGEMTVDSSYLVQYRDFGLPAKARILSFLILGGKEGPMLVDTGFRSPQMLETIGFKGSVPPGIGLESELQRHGLRPADIRFILHTHLHLDHAGKDDIFPRDTTVIMNRRELELGCGGAGGNDYPSIDMKHLIDRVHTPGAAMLLDLEDSGPIELMEGLAVQICGGHTPGSMNVLVETDDGIACICGDLIYHVQDQIIAPSKQMNFREPKITGDTMVRQPQEKGAIKKALNSCKWLLPSHDMPARVERGGVVIGRITGNQVPGPVTLLGAGV